MKADRWIALLDADQQQEGGRLGRDRVACECLTSDSMEEKEALLYCNCSNETYRLFFRRHAPPRDASGWWT